VAVSVRPLGAGKIRMAGSTRRLREVAAYGGLGVAVALAYGLINWYWLALVGWFLGRPIIFDQQPAAARQLNLAVGALPWLIAATLLIFAIVRRRATPIVAYAAGFVAVLVFLASSMALTPALRDYASRTSFDSAAWKAENGPGPRGARVHMVDDLLRQRKLVGMTRREINGLLGVPPPTPYFADYEYVYWLGPERGFISIDSEWLAITFRNDVAVAAKVLRD